MAEKVSRLGIAREDGYLYYLKGTDVWRSPMRHATHLPKGAKLVQKADFPKKEGHMYFLDTDGDISAAKRQVGRMRKASAEKPKAKVTKSNRR